MRIQLRTAIAVAVGAVLTLIGSYTVTIMAA
jgi:hypothetical protein